MERTKKDDRCGSGEGRATRKGSRKTAEGQRLRIGGCVEEATAVVVVVVVEKLVGGGEEANVAKQFYNYVAGSRSGEKYKCASNATIPCLYK